MRILCWSMSALILTGWAIGRSLHPGNVNFPHPFFLFKYSLEILFISIAIVLFIWPILISKGVIGANYHTENEVGKAKIYLVLYGMIFPGLLLVFFSCLITNVDLIPISMLLVLFCYGYLKNVYIFIRKRPSKD